MKKQLLIGLMVVGLAGGITYHTSVRASNVVERIVEKVADKVMGAVSHLIEKAMHDVFNSVSNRICRLECKVLNKDEDGRQLCFDECDQVEYEVELKDSERDFRQSRMTHTRGR